MLKLSENEYWASFDIRTQLIKHGSIDNEFLKNIISLKPYKSGRLNWNLYPKDFNGAFSDALENKFGMKLSHNDSFEDFMSNLSSKVNDHTFFNSFVKDFNPLDWRVYRFIYNKDKDKEKDMDLSGLRRTKGKFHRNVSYCPACMKTKLIKNGYTYFSKNQCSLSSEGHINIELIGCPQCHHNHHYGQTINNSKLGYKNTGIRIIDTLRGECRFCNCRIWEEAPRYLVINRSYEIQRATYRANTMLKFIASDINK